MFNSEKTSRFAFATLAMLCAPMLAVLPARAHEAPSGWKYPTACCSGIDCREVTDRQISERPEGYVIKNTGEVVAYSDTRIRNSPDGVYHWCSVQGADNSRTICLFVPPKGF
jgi:hypothetical protein